MAKLKGKLFARLSLDYPDHPKIAALSDSAWRTHVEMIIYARKYELDGVLPARVVKTKWETDSVSELQANGNPLHSSSMRLRIPTGCTVTRRCRSPAPILRQDARSTRKTGQKVAVREKPKKNRMGLRNETETKPNEKQRQRQRQRQILISRRKSLTRLRDLKSNTFAPFSLTSLRRTARSAQPSRNDGGTRRGS